MSRRPASPRARSAPGALPGAGGTGHGAPRATARPAAPSRRPETRSSRPGGATATRPTNARPAARPGTTGTSKPADTPIDHESRSLQLARLISVRALVLGVVLLVAFSMLFPTIRAYLGQRAELEALAAEVGVAEQAEKDLAAELARWQDQSYVAAQARARLAFVMPGETSYRVIDPDVVVETPVVDGTTVSALTGPTLPAGGAVSPWYATVWDSVQVAGEAPVLEPEAEPDAAPGG